METTGHLGTRRILSIAALLGVLGTLGLQAKAPGVTVHDGTPGQRAVVTWARDRFAQAGLPLPPLDVYFHADPARCGGNSGLYTPGRLDVCAGEQDSPYVRKTIVHELSHAWADAALDAATRRAFLRARGLDRWDDRDDPWGFRGAEQTAEVLTWAIGPGLTPLISDHPSEDDLATAYRILTGTAPPGLGA